MSDANWLAEANIIPIRQMNEHGIEQFRTYLLEVKAGATDPLPDGLLDGNANARILDRRITVEAGVFKTALDMARYLHPRIEALRLLGKYYDPGLWTWLTAFYLESICPSNALGERKVGEIARYIPPANRDFYESNRHLLALPVRMYDKHGENRVELVLYAPPYEQTLILNLITQSQELSTNQSILDALQHLYWDKAVGKPKRGFGSIGKPGTLRRFLTVINQFNRTFDLFAMSGEQIIELLPKEEFGRWLK